MKLQRFDVLNEGRYVEIYIYVVVKSLFNVLMVMSARDRPSAAERDFICNNHSNCQYAGADCDPTSSQNILELL